MKGSTQRSGRWGTAVAASMLVALTLAALLLASGAGASRSPVRAAVDQTQGTKGLVIGDILYDVDAYQIAQQKHMQQYANKLGIKMVFENQDGQGTKAPALVDDLLAKGVNGIIFQPADATVAVPLVKKAQSKHVPVLGWAIPFGKGVKTPYIGLAESAETRAAGKAAAQYVLKNFPGQPVRVLIVTIDGVSICQDVRMGPFEQGVKSVAPSAKFVTVNGAGVRQTAVTVAQDAVTRENDFNIATGCNSDMAMGALQAFKSAGFGGATNKKPAHTYFYSINGTYEELVALTDPNSPLMADLGLAPKEIAETLINTEVKMIKGKIKPYGTYTFNVPDTPLTTNCAAANTFDKVEYFATKNLPCVGK